MKTKLHVLIPFGILLFLGFNTLNAQVGIGTLDPKTQLDVDGAISLREGTALGMATGNNNNVGLTAVPNSFYRITGPVGAFRIGSITPLTDADGQVVTLENTTTQTMTLRHNAGGLGTSRIYCPGGRDLVINGQYSTVTLMYNITQQRWIITNYTNDPTPVDSVTLAADYSLTATGAFSDVSAMSLTFVARETSVLVTLSGSGDANVILAAGIADFRVFNVTSGASFGGTHEKLTTFDDIFGVVSSAWSISFTKPLTGLTVGNSYTLKVQALFDPILVFPGTPALQIFPISLPDDHHLTLSVIQ